MLPVWLVVLLLGVISKCCSLSQPSFPCSSQSFPRSRCSFRQAPCSPSFTPRERGSILTKALTLQFAAIGFPYPAIPCCSQK